MPGGGGRGEEGEVFEAYLERVLAPSLRPQQVVVMDNLSAHKGGRVREIVEAAGCELMYLPPYSPDLNPIEGAFSKVKGLMRRAESRTREALVEAMGRALDAVTAQDARGFFGHSRAFVIAVGPPNGSRVGRTVNTVMLLRRRALRGRIGTQP